MTGVSSAEKIKRQRQKVQTVERAQQTVFDNRFNNSGDVQERLFVFFEINKFKLLWNSFTSDGRSGLSHKCKRRDKMNLLGSLTILHRKEGASLV